MQFLFISCKCLAQTFFYDMQLHFKSFNQMEFVSEIYCEFLKTFLFQDKNTNDQPTKFYWFLSSLRIKIIWMNSPVCQLTIFTIRHWIYLKASIWGMVMCCMHSPSLFPWSILLNFRPKLPHCHVLQMTGSNSETRYSSSLVYQQKAYQK